MDHSSPHTRKKNAVTIIDVARESGVSYSTVSRVLSGFEYVSDDTRERVLAVAKRLGYVANLQARSLAGGRSNVVGVLVPGLDNGYIIEVTRGIDEELNRQGYSLMLYTTHQQHGKETQFVSAIANGLCDGLLLVVPVVPDDYLDVLQQRKFPYVLVDQADSTRRHNSICSTNWQGAYDATQHLINLGHRQIGIITGRMDLSSGIERLEGYKSALATHDIALDERLIYPGDFFQPTGYTGGHHLLGLPTPPTAIFAGNDLMAFGVLQAAGERGVRVPDDLSVVGFDDIPYSVMMHPRLTTVRQLLDEMGRVAVQMLLKHIEQPESTPHHITLDTQLIVRESSAPPRHLKK
ncbi:MAG: LacI family transcriptional regulator [Anaerolineae bacterium]|nr:LacI family transcriptional regulator [Anaerolineae bacterium]